LVELLKDLRKKVSKEKKPAALCYLFGKQFRRYGYHVPHINGGTGKDKWCK
jgi:hypothetical protein